MVATSSKPPNPQTPKPPMLTVANLPSGILRCSWPQWAALGLVFLLNLSCGSGTAPSGAITAAPVRPAAAAAPDSTTAWSFAVMADSQWMAEDDGESPDEVPVGIINQMNAEFIRHKVKFVVEAGDITNTGTRTSLDLRATFTQALYNAGIGFYPLRGNHEPTAQAAAEFTRIFPQTRDGVNNATPLDAFVSTDDDDRLLPVQKSGALFQVGSNFSSPSQALRGLSYAFDFNNARFILLDQFTPPDGSANSIAAQQGWISSALASRPQGTHAFVLGHKNLICPYQGDSLFGSFPEDSVPVAFSAQDAFISSLADHGVRYYIHGHDHFHERVNVSTSDGSGKAVTAIFSAAAANEVKVPRAARPWWDPAQVPGYRRSIHAQQVNTVGYYVYTVDGPAVTVAYYAADLDSVFNPEGNWGSGDFTITKTPALAFRLRETFGYSLSGREFSVAQGDAYAGLGHSSGGTTATFLGGRHGSLAVDYSGAPLVKALNLGWQPGTQDLLSPVLNLWGLADLGDAGPPDTYVLSLTYDHKALNPGVAEQGWIGLATPLHGLWSNAVDGNQGGTKAFVKGPWLPSHGLGTYGVDPATGTAWAVLNHAGPFAVAPLP